MKLIENIKNGPITTIVGISLLCFSGAMIWTDRKDMQLVSVQLVLFLIGLSLVVSKDSIVNKILNKIIGGSEK